jgi:adenine-specific DNA methylase
MLGKTEKDIFGEDIHIGDDDELLFKIVFNLPINWVGNKKRMLNRLLIFMNEHNVKHDSFFDVFAGSGVVSLLAVASGKTVFSNDLLTLASTGLIQLLSGKPSPLSLDECLELLETTKNNIGQPSKIEFLSDLYNGALLTKDEVSYISSYRNSVSKLFGKYMFIGNRLYKSVYAPAYIDLESGEVVFDKITGSPEKVTFSMNMMCVHILQQAFMGGRCYKSQLLAISEKRLKDGKIGRDGNSNAIGNESHLVNLLRPSTCPIKAIGNFLSTKDYSSTIFNCDAETLISSGLIKPDVAYFDPPYGGYNSDYAWMYRVCEEFLTGNKLEESEELREAAVKFKGDDYERDKAFAKKERKGYSENFSNLLNFSKDFPYWIISFNESSFSSIDDIIGIVSSFRKDLVVETVDGYRYNYREKATKNGSEYIILARA